jgi:hypothetical protein
MGFAKLDFFRKMPKDLTEPTFCGAIGKHLDTLGYSTLYNIVSTVCTVIIGVLCFTEIMRYFSVDIKSDMLVDVSHHDD